MRGKLRNTGTCALDVMASTELFIAKPKLKVASLETKE
jgi:hypothetical protein